MARGRCIVIDSSDDEFPDLQDITSFKAKASLKSATSPATKTDQPWPPKTAVRRRKLGAIADNPLLRPLSDDTGSATPKPKKSAPQKNSTTPQRVELRTRKTNPIVTSVEVDDQSETVSIHEETIIEDFSEDDDGESDFKGSESSGSENDDDDDSPSGEALRRSPSKSKKIEKGSQDSRLPSERKRSPSPNTQLLAEALEAEERNDTRRSRSISKGATEEVSSEKCPSSADLVDPLSKLQIYKLLPPRSSSLEKQIPRPRTPTSPPPKPKYKGLVSPSKKISRIPPTPHHPQMDTFWDREFIDEWNDEHSPKKELFPPSTASKSPSKKASSSTKRGEPTQAAVQKAAKKAFSESKHEVADKFLRELDERITEGKLSELSAGTGGIRIEWSNKLNTTAGRANWKRETIKSKGQDEEAPSVRYRHHAFIELSTKVIDDTHRLLNVIAHEFCHLANFMVSGVTKNPHGREFKAWAARVTLAFGDDRGIEVTTKHAYDIDFKYVWECTACGTEFKRHSKSITPERHRCGVCKSELRQTKPVPRARPGGESEYQRFMKEQMKAIKQENPGCPQKDIMKVVASRWSQREKEKGKDSRDGTPTSSSSCSSSQASAGKGKDAVEGVSKGLNHLTVVDLT